MTCSEFEFHLSIHIHIFINFPLTVNKQDGWWRFKHEEVLAPASVEESGAGLVRGKKGRKNCFLHQNELIT